MTNNNGLDNGATITVLCPEIAELDPNEDTVNGYDKTK